MTTLAAIGTYVGAGAVVWLSVHVAFGCAIRHRTIGVAPRCAGRPLDTIYNPSATADSSQQRGSATWGWYRWVMKWTYSGMMEGIPGTGTRNRGLDGRMLRMNLDQIVILRFHAICLRVAWLAAFLCLVVIIPLNLTGGCDSIRDTFTSVDEALLNKTGCELFPTDYEKTTMANIPVLIDEVCDYSQTGRHGCAEYQIRYCIIAFCGWVLTWYTCRLCRSEWTNMLQLRRKHYLEANIWGRRKKELEETLLSTDLGGSAADSDSRLLSRNPWIPHPEIRECCPSIELYSVLIGGLPSNPTEAVENVEDAIVFSRRHSIDWQLDVTRTFFDRCVPNQPGFSSSVAAVSILPGSSELSATWKKWSAHAAALRRLRFIKSVIKEKQQNATASSNNNNNSSTTTTTAPPQQVLTHQGSSKKRGGARGAYRSSVRNMSFYRKVLGSTAEEEIANDLLDEMSFDPEQTSQYSLEFAQSSAGCCPNGSNEKRIRNSSLDELYKMEEDAVQNVQEAKAELCKAQDKSRMVIEDDEEPNNHKSSTTASAAPPPQDVSAAAQRSIAELNTSQHDMSEFHDIEAAASGGESISLKVADYMESSRKLLDYSGTWKRPKLKDLCSFGKRTVQKGGELANEGQTRVLNTVKDNMLRESCYAAVTFTSRQAAVAARHSLLDGRGTTYWIGEESIPVPPLADAAVCSGGRNMCRPVTMSIPEAQKTQRHYSTLLMLATIYLFYSIPLSFASTLSNPTTWAGIFPNMSTYAVRYPIIQNLLSLIPGLIFTVFFAVLPQVFKLLANFGSIANSAVESEFSATKYYWYFMNISAFWGTTLGNAILQLFNQSNLNEQLRNTIVAVANAIPTTISSTWLTWMITRALVTLPFNYMLQLNTYLFGFLRMGCLERANRGGGPGGPMPYRIYIDSGVCFLCLVALAPTSPLVSAASLLNFLYVTPLLRRNLIFVYRPRFNSGGIRWIFLFEMLTSCLITGQVCLTAVLALRGGRNGIAAPVLAALQIIPTFLFRRRMKWQYLKPFKDAGLIQTSFLDGWDETEDTSMEQREEYRRFLVDAHKAAYVPVCIAGGKTHVLTAEPAVVIPCDRDADPAPYRASIISRQQKGFSLRRVSQSQRLDLSQILSEDSGPSTSLEAQESGRNNLEVSAARDLDSSGSTGFFPTVDEIPLTLSKPTLQSSSLESMKHSGSE